LLKLFKFHLLPLKTRGKEALSGEKKIGLSAVKFIGGEKVLRVHPAPLGFILKVFTLKGSRPETPIRGRGKGLRPEGLKITVGKILL